MKLCDVVMWIEEEDFPCDRIKGHVGRHRFTGPYYIISWKLPPRKRQDSK